MNSKKNQKLPWMVGGKEPPAIAGRTPPHDLDAEAAVISACMLTAGAYDEVAGMGLLGDHFFSTQNGLIYDTIAKLRDQDVAVDVVTVVAHLRRVQMIQKAGGAAYLGELLDATPSVANVNEHAKIVIDHRRLRKAIETAHHFAAHGYDEMPDVQAFLDNFESVLFSVAEDTSSTGDMVPIGAAVRANHEQRKLGVVPGLKTGFMQYDKATGGMFPGDLIIVAARPGMGKTGFVMCVAGNVARWVDKSRGHTPGEGGAPDTWAKVRPQYVAVFSIEMPKEQLANRMVAWRARTDVKLLRSNDSPPEEAGAIAYAEDEVSRWPMYIDDSSDVTINQIRSRTRRLKAQARAAGGDLVLIVVDYLQLMEGPAGAKDNRQEEVSKVSRGLKKCAKELKVPVVALSQLNRDVEKRGGDQRPKISDIRECIPFADWVATPSGPMRIGDEPSEVVAVNPRGAVVRDCEYIPKRYNTVFEVRSQFGTFRATARHRVLTGTGYREVRDLVAGRDVVASPKRIPHADRGPLSHGRLLGWLLGNGYLRGTPSVILRDELFDDLLEAIKPFDVQVNMRPKRSHNVFDAYLSQGRESGCLPNPLMTWLRELGLEGSLSHVKHVPAAYLGSSDDTHRDLLRGLWETDGTVTKGVAKYATSSEVLAQQVAWLLLTVGVRSTVTLHDSMYSVNASRCDAVNMDDIVTGKASDDKRFGQLGYPNKYRTDPAPAIFTELAAELCPRHVRRFQKRGDGSLKSINKDDLRHLVEIVPGLASVSESPYMTMRGVGWGRVESVTELPGEVRVADLSVPGPNNFVTSGIVAHNSGAIEQDADVIMFMYREDYYSDPGDTVDHTDGKTELIIAKQRNGPPGLAHAKFHAKSASFTDPNDEAEQW